MIVSVLILEGPWGAYNLHLVIIAKHQQIS